MLGAAGAVLPALAGGEMLESLVPAELLGAMQLERGLWRTTLTVTDVDVSPAVEGTELPPGSEEPARRLLGMSRVNEECSGGGPGADGTLVLPGIAISDECTFSDFRAANGRLSLRATCGEAANGFSGEMQVEGTYSASSMNATVRATAYTQAGGGLVTRLTVSTASTHAGRCS